MIWSIPTSGTPYIYICICICICLCLYIYIYRHTHTHEVVNYFLTGMHIQAVYPCRCLNSQAAFFRFARKGGNATSRGYHHLFLGMWIPIGQLHGSTPTVGKGIQKSHRWATTTAGMALGCNHLLLFGIDLSNCKALCAESAIFKGWWILRLRYNLRVLNKNVENQHEPNGFSIETSTFFLLISAGRVDSVHPSPKRLSGERPSTGGPVPMSGEGVHQQKSGYPLVN